MAFVGPAIGVTQISYDINTGIATVGTGITAHGLLAGSKVKLAGAGQTVYNGVFVVQENVGLSTFTVNLGVSTVSAPTLSGTVFGFPGGYSSADGAISADDEKIGSRMSNFFVGITTTLSAGITSTSSSISISDATASGLNIGDYIMVNDEMMRIKNTSINSVFRGVFGTKSTNHVSGTQIKKVRVVPVESRRNSLIRAANQTFEYVGFGQGNYSVALPEKQTKVLSTEDRKLGQTQKRGGGQNFYTGLNDVGEYFIGNKVIKGTTGEEEIFDAPITSVTGEGHDVYKTDTDAIKVTGGANKDVLSEFNGPSVFTNKVTSTSVDGIEAVSLQLQGDGKVARKITVGIATPSVGGAAGDVVLTTKPSESGYAGWVFTTQNTWRKFGLVSKDEDSVVVSADKIGIGTTNPSQELDVHGSVNITGVLTATTFGNINAGIVTGTSFAGDGSALTGVIGIGSGFVVQDSGTAVGTAATVNFGDNLSVTFAAGISTITGIGTENIRTNTNATFLQNINVSGTVTATSYAGDGSALTGMASTDNVRTGILDVAGISTFRANSLVGSGITLSPDGDAFFTGVVTATTFIGDGSSLTGTGDTSNVRTGILDVAGIATFRDDIIVGAGVTISPDGDIYATGITTFAKQIVGISTNNIVPFLFNNYSDLPSASTYHGQFAHVHVAGKAFYAHAGAWYQLVNVGSDLTVGLGTEKYNVGILTATTVKVGSGITLSSDGDAFVTGISTATKFVGDLSDAVTSRWAVVNNSNNHYSFTGPGGLSSSDDPTIYLARGQTYEFNLNASGHPFHIQTSSGAYNSSNLYTTGVTNPGAAVGVIKFSVPFAAPNTLYYVCQNHSSMAGTIVVYPSI